MQQRSVNNDILIDVSHWQGNIDWNKLVDHTFSDGRKIKGIIIKATEGQQYVDDKVYDNYNGARSVGLQTGLYHFCRAANTSEAKKEAEFYKSVYDACGGQAGNLFPPILDIETTEAQTAEGISSVCRVWLEYIEAMCGVKPMIYTGRGFIDSYLDTSLSKYKLWLAAYDSNYLPDRKGWTEWTILQYTQTGTVSGINGYVDLNEYNGRIDDLMGTTSTDNAEIEALKAENVVLKNRITALEQMMTMPSVPEWAQASVNKAVSAGMIDTPNGGSYDFYRILVIMDRKGFL